MKKIILFYLSFCTSVVFAQSFYQQFPTALNLDYDVAAVEISNGYILGDNEANSANNFHGVIRLSRTDFSGNILWSKQYDAGSGTTVHLLNLLKTILICARLPGKCNCATFRFKRCIRSKCFLRRKFSGAL